MGKLSKENSTFEIYPNWFKKCFILSQNWFVDDPNQYPLKELRNAYNDGLDIPQLYQKIFNKD